MKPVHYFILSAFAFSAGAWVASERLRDEPKELLNHSGAGVEGERMVLKAGFAWFRQYGESPEQLAVSAKGTGVLKRRGCYYEALRNVTHQDLPALISRASELPPYFRKLLTNALVERWFELDANGARAWVVSHPRDEEMLIAWANAIPNPFSRTRLLEE
jgi:hypothetical protein